MFITINGNYGACEDLERLTCFNKVSYALVGGCLDGLDGGIMLGWVQSKHSFVQISILHRRH